MPTKETEMPQLDDSVRAAFKANFKVNLSRLQDIIEAYRKRKYIEDLDSIQELGGSSGLQDALDVNMSNGIAASSLDVREKVFGSHHKDLPTRESFCSMVLGALDDFMLKLLIVCAFFSIVVDMGFAWGTDKMYTAWIEGAAILFAVIIVSHVSAWSDYEKEGQFLK